MAPRSPDCVPATVRHISRDHITIAPAKGYSVTVWSVTDTDLEAFVTADDASETIRLRLELPGPGRTVAIKRHEPTGITDVIYAEKPDV